MRICRASRAWLSLAVLLAVLGSAPSAGAVVLINVGSATGVPGGTAQFLVTLSTGGAQVGGTLNSVFFDPVTPILACTTNPGMTLSQCALQPQDCTPGVDCQFVRCFIGQLASPPPPIADGAVLYFCTVDIASNADVTSYPLTCSDASAADVNNKPLQVECSDGEVQVVPVLVAHAPQGATTLTLTSPVPTSPAFAGFPVAGTITEIDGASGLNIGYTLGSDNVTLTLLEPLPFDVSDDTQITVVPPPTPTPTPTATATTTPTPTPTATPAPGGGGGGDGCQMASVCQSYTGLLLMMPVMWLWQCRRRSRRLRTSHVISA
jgi:hypothetical protein